MFFSKKLSLAILSFIFSFQLLAEGSLDGYFKRFEIVRKDGKVTLIKDRSLSQGISVDGVIAYLKDSLIAEQKLMNLKSDDYSNEIDELLELDYTLKDNQEYAARIHESVESIGGLNLEQVMQEDDVKFVLNEFQKKLNEKLTFLDISILANPSEARFFYVRSVTYEAVIFALNLAKKKFASVPILNVVSYIIVETEKLIRERRTFHQNMLLHYLENYPEADLKLTHDEVNLIMSSIYESRISWMNILESNAAARNWSKYGVDKFFTSVRAGNTQMRTYTHIYDEVSDKINYAFQKTTYKGKKVIVNLVNSQNSFSAKPAISYYFDDPNRVIRTRQIIQIALLGMNIIPIPNFIKGQVTNFLDSMYKEHKLTEGALFAYFESQKDAKTLQLIRLAQVNPFTAPSL